MPMMPGAAPTHVDGRPIRRSRVQASRAVDLRTYAPAAAAVVAVAWWLFAVTRAWAGRDAPSVTVGAALVAVAVLLVRPDRVLPALATGLAAAISAAAFVVALVAPSGWAGAPTAATYVCASWIVLIVAASIRRWPQLRLGFVVLVVASAPIELAEGWLGWVGNRDPSIPMVGTFYWHNQFAVFLVPGGLLGLWFVAWRPRIFAVLGGLGFVCATVGIVYSTSRATLACFAVGVVVMLGMAVLTPSRVRTTAKIVAVGALAAVVTWVIAGPPLFPHRSSPFSAIHARTAGESLGQNGGYRVDFWHEALTVFRNHPVSGGGYKSLVAESLHHVPTSWPLSPYAHSGYLQALSDGGLVLGIPFLLAMVLIVWFTVRSLGSSAIRRDPSLAGFAAPLALAALLAHSAVDFDWTYAADFAVTAVLVGLVVPLPHPAPGQPAWARRGLALAVLAGVALLGLSSWVFRNGDHRENLPVPGTRTFAASDGLPSSTSSPVWVDASSAGLLDPIR